MKLHSDFLQRARVTVEAEVRGDDSALTLGQAAQRGRQRQLGLVVERLVLRVRCFNIGERSGQRQPVDPERLVE